MARPDEELRVPDDDLALLDDDPRVRRHALAVDAGAVARAEVLHADATVLEQGQHRVLGRGVLVVHHDVAAEVAPDAALRAGAGDALAQHGVPVRAELLDEHHGFHCRAPR